MRNFLLSLHNKQQKSVLHGIFLTLLLFLFSGLFVLQAQTTVCKEFLYVNEPSGVVHKMQVNPSTGALTEVGGVNGTPWLNNPTEFPFPHGLGVDRNGFLYIGSNFGSPNDIRKLDCRGSLFPESQYRIPALPTSNNWGFLLTNIQSHNGFIYANGPSARIYKIDPCTGATIGYVQFQDNSDDWGLYIDKSGKFYVTQPTGKIYAFTPTAADFTSNSTFPLLIDLNATPSIGGLSPAYDKKGLQGIVTDNVGNIYVVEGNRDVSGTPSRLLKFSSTGTFIAAGPIDNNGGDNKGWNQMTGVIYSASADRLYTTSLNPNEDCVYRWKTDLTPDGEAVGPVPTPFGQCKAIGILSECCPVSDTIVRSVCGVKVGDRISLSELLKANGIVCEGQWAPLMGNTNLTYNECDLTVTVGDLPACGSFTISNVGMTDTSCDPFTIRLDVTYLAEVQAQEIAGDQQVCPTDNPAAFTVTSAAASVPPGETITYQWQSSTTSATTGFTDITSGGNSATYDSGPVSQTTYFRVIASISGCTGNTCSDTSNVVTLTLKSNCEPPVSKPGGWDFACEDGVMVETVGKSGFSVSNPAANCTGSGTATITIPNGTSADSIYIEAVYKASNPGPSITFKDAANNNYVAQRYTLPLGDGYVYRTKVPATASISLTDGTKFCALQSLVAYVFRKQAGMSSTGVFTCEQGFQNTVTVNLPLPTLTKPADVTVCVPISELTNDGRLLQIKVTAGAIVKDTTITGSDPVFGTCCLAIPKLKLVNVPVGTTTVKVEIISPISPAGQSFTVASAISANVQCEKCTPPTRTVQVTDPTCTTAGKIELTATNGDKYGVSKGATYTGPAYASATAVPGTLPVLLKGNISHAADSAWTIRVFNAANDCFKDTTVTVKAAPVKPTITQQAGSPVCRNNGTTYTIKFTATGGTVVTTPSFPVTGDSIANIPLTTTSVKLIITNQAGCKDSITVNAPTCAKPVGSIGDFIWKDVNDNGLQDLPTEKGVAGVKVNLYAASGGTKTGAILQTKTTDTDGLYLFTGLLAGDYIVEIDKTTLKDTCAITTKQNTPSDDTKDSDFNPTSGLSQVITLNPVFNPTTPTEQLATNNLTVDAGLVKVCIVPTRTVAATNPTCAVAGKIELTATNGDKYGVSKGATYTGPAYATATAVGTLPILIKGNISHSADSTWTIRVFNKDNTCYKDTTVTVKALVKDATISVNSGFPACRQNGTAYSIKFTKSPNGAVVTAKNAVTGATIAVTGDSVANVPLSVVQVRLIVTNGVCKDSITVNAPTCAKPVGSIGDFIWKDVNDNGLQDLPTEKGVAGVKVNLYAASGGTKTGAILQTKTTDTDGLYLFTGLLAGDYIVEIDKTTLPTTCEITGKQNIPSDDTKDSDFNPTSGLSQVVPLNPVFNPTTPTELLATNNLTVDAGLVVPCVKSKVTLTGAPICSADVQTYSITFSVTGKNGTIKVNKGTLTGSNPYTVTGIPSGAVIKITDSLSTVCKFDTLISGPNCNCNPSLPTILTPSMTACAGDTFPTLKATVVGLATVEWFTQATGGTAVFTGLNYKPSGTVPITGAVFYAQARSTDPSCPAAISTGRVMATINAQNCTVEVDLALKKSINTKIAQIGDVLTYTLKVWNESNTNATGVEVTDSIATTVQFQTASFTASRGSASISGNVIQWNIGNIAANGDTVTLTYKVKATREGVHFNTAEISKVNEKDIDSTPDNGKENEDDIDRQCFTVPIKLCTGEKVQASVPANLTNVKWFKNGGTTAIANGNSVLLTEVGTYTFTATNQTCPTGGCCPVIIEPGTNCCPAEVCIPLTIKKRKK